MTSLIRAPHYSDHVKFVPNTAKVYFMTLLIRPPYCSNHVTQVPITAESRVTVQQGVAGYEFLLNMIG